MNMEKIWNSGLGIVLAVLAVLVAGRIVNIISWTLLKTGGYVVLAGILLYAFSGIRNRN